MIVASALPFRFRAIVDFKSNAERNRITRFLNELEGKVAVMGHPMITNRMICDFDRSGDRDAFQMAVRRGIPAPAVLRRRFTEAAAA